MKQTHHLFQREGHAIWEQKYEARNNKFVIRKRDSTYCTATKQMKHSMWKGFC
jgi:hypothetical protein